MANWLISVNDKVFYLGDSEKDFKEKIDFLEDQPDVDSIDVYQLKISCVKARNGRWIEREV